MSPQHWVSVAKIALLLAVSGGGEFRLLDRLDRFLLIRRYAPAHTRARVTVH
jgi:hypothetical protein